MKDGFITLHRQIEEWEWYTDIPVKTLFIHLLIKANHKDEKWQGKIIKRGQRITSIEHLALETGLSKQQVRTAIKKLKSTHEISTQATNKYTLITIENYSHFQDKKEKSNKQITHKATNKQQTNNKQITTNNNDNNDNNSFNNINNINNHNNSNNHSNSNTTQKKNIKRKGYSVEEQIAKIESKVLQEDLQDFVTMRKTIKDPITDRGMKILINKLVKLSEGNEAKAHELLEEAIEKNWKSVYASDCKKEKPRNEVLEMLENGVFDD